MTDGQGQGMREETRTGTAAEKQKQGQRYIDRDNAKEIVMKEQGWVH